MNWIFYAIKHETRGFLPPAKYHPSEVEPTLAELPRLFRTERAAKSALVQWLKGIFKDHGKVVPQPHRKSEEMSVIPVMVSEMENGPAK